MRTLQTTETICPITGKFRYLTAARIEAVLDAVVFHGEDSHPRGYYWHEACEAYHLTSQTRGRHYHRKEKLAYVRPLLAAEEP